MADNLVYSEDDGYDAEDVLACIKTKFAEGMYLSEFEVVGVPDTREWNMSFAPVPVVEKVEARKFY